MSKVYNDCTVETVKTKDGSIEVLWKRNHPITDEESLDALEDPVNFDRGAEIFIER